MKTFIIVLLLFFSLPFQSCKNKNKLKHKLKFKKLATSGGSDQGFIVKPKIRKKKSK